MRFVHWRVNSTCMTRAKPPSSALIQGFFFILSICQKEGLGAWEQHTTLRTYSNADTQKHIQKLLTLLQLINFALQSSLRTIRIPWRNDFPIKGDLGEDSLFISDSRSSLFQSFKLELIFQFSHWLLWTCSRGGQIELRSEIFVPHKVTVASNTLMCFARHCRRQQIFSSACWWRESPSRVATSLTLQSTGLVPVGFFFLAEYDWIYFSCKAKAAVM